MTDDTVIRSLLDGARLTVLLTVLSFALALVIAFVSAFLQLSRHRAVRILATAYIELFRGTSAIVQLFLLFYVIPMVGISLPPLLVGVVTLGLNFGAYASQIVRAGIEAVDPGQRQATVALSMSDWTAMRRVVLPQAIPLMVPGMGNELIEILKATAIVSLIGLADITWTGKLLVESQGHATATLLGILVLYFLLALPLVLLTKYAEKRSRRRLGASAVGLV